MCNKNIIVSSNYWLQIRKRGSNPRGVLLRKLWRKIVYFFNLNLHMLAGRSKKDFSDCMHELYSSISDASRETEQKY